MSWASHSPVIATTSQKRSAPRRSGFCFAATALQLLALLSRCEAWYTCVSAAGGVISRRRLFHAGGLGNLGSLLNAQVGAAARIGILRRSGRDEVPHIPALIAAEVPIIAIEAALAVLASYTLVGPLGLPWWSPLVGFALAVAVVLGLRKLAGKGHGVWAGLAVLRSLDGRRRVTAFVLLAVFAQIFRNWLVLRALGVDASIFDATAVLIAMVALSQLPIGPSVGAAAVVMILGAGGVALTAAAGVLLTATGIAGALSFAAWAGIDVLARPRERARRRALRVAAPRKSQAGGRSGRIAAARLIGVSDERPSFSVEYLEPPAPIEAEPLPDEFSPQPQALADRPRRDRRRHRGARSCCSPASTRCASASAARSRAGSRSPSCSSSPRARPTFSSSAASSATG